MAGARSSPPGSPSSKEWGQVNRAGAADYALDLVLFQASIDFVRGGG